MYLAWISAHTSDVWCVWLHRIYGDGRVEQLMIGGPNFRYVRAKPPLAQCIITALEVVFGCACSECPSSSVETTMATMLLHRPRPCNYNYSSISMVANTRDFYLTQKVPIRSPYLFIFCNCRVDQSELLRVQGKYGQWKQTAMSHRLIRLDKSY